MLQSKSRLGLALTSVLAVAILTIVPVSAAKAEDGSEVNKRSVKTAQTTDTDSSGSDSEATTGDVSTLKQNARKQLAADRLAKKKESKQADRQKACEAREANLNKKIKNFGAAADRHLTRLNGTYDKLQKFQDEKKLDVSNYDELVSTADGKKTAATEAVTALKEVTVEIDCTSGDPAESVATVKTSAKNAKKALQEYHISIKNVLVALMTAKSADSDSTGDDGTDAGAGTGDSTTGGSTDSTGGTN